MDQLDTKLILELKLLLEKNFGNRIISILSYGSRVSKNNKESDFDIMILIDDLVTWQLEYKISSVITRFGIENGILFDPQILSKKDFDHYSTFSPFFQNVKTNSVAL